MNTTEFYAKVTSMPSLRHVDEDGAYRIEKSEVLKWLLAQPEVQDWVFFRMKDANVIKYDDLTRTWSGNPDCVKVVAGEFTEEEMLSQLPEKGKGLDFSDWLAACEVAFERRSGMWSFIRASKRMLNRGTVQKSGKRYRRADKEEGK